MKKKIAFLIVALITIVCCTSAVSAGLFDGFFGGEEVANVTWEFGDISLDFPETFEVINETDETTEPLAVFEAIDNETNETYSIISIPTKYAKTLDQYLAANPDFESKGAYKKWNVIYNPDEKEYEIVKIYGDNQYMIYGEDLDKLKGIVDTAKEI